MDDLDNDHREDDDLGVDVPSLQPLSLATDSELAAVDNDGLLSRMRKISIIDAGASTITVYLAIKGAVATVLGWQYSDFLADKAVDFQEYNELVYALSAGVGTVLTSASFWALMTTLGVRAVAKKILDGRPKKDDEEI